MSPHITMSPVRDKRPVTGSLEGTSGCNKHAQEMQGLSWNISLALECEEQEHRDELEQELIRSRKQREE